MKTAIEILKSKETYDEEYPTVSLSDTEEAMIEFAKLHVEAALVKASEAKRAWQSNFLITQNILNSYSLDNIK